MLPQLLGSYKNIENLALEEITTVPIFNFRVEANQESDLDGEFLGLVESIDKFGVIEPIIVRPVTPPSPRRGGGSRQFELVSGHRRYMACARLGFATIPCVVMLLDDQKAFEVALVENVQRRELNPIEYIIYRKEFHAMQKVHRVVVQFLLQLLRPWCACRYTKRNDLSEMP